MKVVYQKIYNNFPVKKSDNKKIINKTNKKSTKKKRVIVLPLVGLLDSLNNIFHKHCNISSEITNGVATKKFMQ